MVQNHNTLFIINEIVQDVHNFFNLTPIRPPFEPTRPSLPPLQDYEKKWNLSWRFSDWFWQFPAKNCNSDDARSSLLLLRFSPFFLLDFLLLSCRISSSLSRKTPPLGMAQVSHLLEWFGMKLLAFIYRLLQPITWCHLSQYRPSISKTQSYIWMRFQIQRWS